MSAVENKRKPRRKTSETRSSLFCSGEKTKSMTGGKRTFYGSLFHWKIFLNLLCVYCTVAENLLIYSYIVFSFKILITLSHPCCAVRKTLMRGNEKVFSLTEFWIFNDIVGSFHFIFRLRLLFISIYENGSRRHGILSYNKCGKIHDIDVNACAWPKIRWVYLLWHLRYTLIYHKTAHANGRQTYT